MDTFWLLIICAVLIIEKLTADLRTEYKLIGNNGSAYEADARYLKLQCGHMYSRNIYAGVELRWVKNSCLGILSNWSTSIDNMPAEQFGYMIKTVVKDVYHPSRVIDKSNTYYDDLPQQFDVGSRVDILFQPSSSWDRFFIELNSFLPGDKVIRMVFTNGTSDVKIHQRQNFTSKGSGKGSLIPFGSEPVQISFISSDTSVQVEVDGTDYFSLSTNTIPINTTNGVGFYFGSGDGHINLYDVSMRFPNASKKFCSQFGLSDC